MALPTGTELLVAASVAGGGAIVAWFAKVVIEVRDHMRSVRHAMYGDESSKVPDGLLVKVDSNSRRLDSLEGVVGEFHTRLENVENTCVVMHGKVVVRAQE